MTPWLQENTRYSRRFPSITSETGWNTIGYQRESRTPCIDEWLLYEQELEASVSSLQAIRILLQLYEIVNLNKLGR